MSFSVSIKLIASQLDFFFRFRYSLMSMQLLSMKDIIMISGIIETISMQNAHHQLSVKATTMADTAYPNSSPIGDALIHKVIHRVFLSQGAKASTQTGRKIVMITQVTPDRNRAGAIVAHCVLKVKLIMARFCKIMHPRRAHLVGSRSKSGIASKLPKDKNLS